METWQRVLVIVGAILGFLLIYFLISFLLWLYTGKLAKKVQAEFEKMLPFEQTRIDLLKKAWKQIDDQNIGYKRELKSEMEKAFENYASPDPSERRKAKETLDFSYIYTRKLLDERGRKTDTNKALIESLQKMEADSESAYYKYDKAAIKYNAFLSMIFVKLINKMAGKHRRNQALIY